MSAARGGCGLVSPFRSAAAGPSKNAFSLSRARPSGPHFQLTAWPRYWAIPRPVMASLTSLAVTAPRGWRPCMEWHATSPAAQIFSTSSGRRCRPRCRHSSSAPRAGSGSAAVIGSIPETLCSPSRIKGQPLCESARRQVSQIEDDIIEAVVPGKPAPPGSPSSPTGRRYRAAPADLVRVLLHEALPRLLRRYPPSPGSPPS